MSNCPFLIHGLKLSFIYILYIVLICDNCCFSQICSPTIKVDDWFPSSVEKTKENQAQKHLEAFKDAFCLCFLLCPCRRLVGSHHRLLFDILVKFDQTGKTDVWRLKTLAQILLSDWIKWPHGFLSTTAIGQSISVCFLKNFRMCLQQIG